MIVDTRVDVNKLGFHVEVSHVWYRIFDGASKRDFDSWRFGIPKNLLPVAKPSA